MDHTPVQLPPAVQNMVAACTGRGLALPALILLAGHRPLAFVTGQALALAAPLAEIMGQHGIGEWAALLSDPEGPGRLLAALHAEST